MQTSLAFLRDTTIAAAFMVAFISAACLVVGHSPLKVLGLSLAMGG